MGELSSDGSNESPHRTAPLPRLPLPRQHRGGEEEEEEEEEDADRGVESSKG